MRSYEDLTRDHRPVKGGLREEELRIAKAGFIQEQDRINFNPEDMHDFDASIKHGAPVTRCIGDFRFKINESLSIDKQAVICIPDVRTNNSWK
jgi:hypothetical protein